MVLEHEENRPIAKLFRHCQQPVQIAHAESITFAEAFSHPDGLVKCYPKCLYKL